MANFTRNIFSGHLASIGEGGRSRPYKREWTWNRNKDEDVIPGIKIQTELQNSAAVEYKTGTEFVSELVGPRRLKFQSLLNKEATGGKKSNTIVKVLKF